MTVLHLGQICPDPDTWLDPLDNAMRMFEINTMSRIKMFLAQVAHESAGFTATVENLNYSAAGLRATFPHRFTDQEAADYAREPERIANHAYANINGNGDEASGDGWRYRGRGLIQLTARGNYERCGRAIGVDLITAPMMLEVPEFAAKSAGWFWQANGCNELADADDFLGTTKHINGGTNGHDDGTSNSRVAWLGKVERSIT